jgi:predicted secreted protein
MNDLYKNISSWIVLFFVMPLVALAQDTDPNAGFVVPASPTVADATAQEELARNLVAGALFTTSPSHLFEVRTRAQAHVINAEQIRRLVAGLPARTFDQVKSMAETAVRQAGKTQTAADTLDDARARVEFLNKVTAGEATWPWPK